jgi:hypothetical protein
MKNALTLAVLAVLATACTTIQPVAFERLEAADVSFPETVRRIAVVNNVPDIIPDTHPGIISTWMEGEGPTATESLAEQIASTNYFEAVLIADTAFNTRGALTLEETLLSREQVDRCTAALSADLLVTLDRVILHARPAVFYDEEFMMPMEGLDVVITPVVRVYLPGRDAPMFTLAPSDSISWYASAHPTDSLVRHEASTYAGGIPLHHLLPHWQEVSRYYYDGGTVDMRDAGVSVREHDWATAASLWQRVYDSKKGKSRRMAAYNLALYHEMQDEVPAALEWIMHALEGAKQGTAEYNDAQLYLAQLQERAKALAKLNAQMQRFDENKSSDDKNN